MLSLSAYMKCLFLNSQINHEFVYTNTPWKSGLFLRVFVSYLLYYTPPFSLCLYVGVLKQFPF